MSLCSFLVDPIFLPYTRSLWPSVPSVGGLSWSVAGGFAIGIAIAIAVAIAFGFGLGLLPFPLLLPLGFVDFLAANIECSILERSEFGF